MNQQPDASRLFLDVAGVSHRFGTTQVLRDVSFHVHAGKVVCLVGHSGCGKTTLLRILAGIERPMSGRVDVDGTTFSGPRTFVEPEDRNIGLLFQDYALFPHLSVTDNILFGLKRHGRAAARRLCDDILSRLDLKHLADRFPHMLSGGEQQRVALARALAPRPGILLMDEPFSNLDRSLRDGIRRETLSILENLGTTVVMVTHDPEEALSAGHLVVLMREGRIVQTGTPSEVFERPVDSYAAEFFASSNRFTGTCDAGKVTTAIGRFDAGHVADGSRATVHIRPHDMVFSETGDGVSAIVSGCTLLGEIEEVQLKLEHCATPVRVRSTKRAGLCVGDVVRIEVSAQQVFVFAGEAEV